MNTKKQIQVVKLNLAVGDAKPGPLLAPILGQSQINIQSFCKDFIELTSHMSDGVKLPVKIKKYEDKSFKIFFKAPPLNYIYEQLVLDRNDNNFSVIKKNELVDMLNIVKSFYRNENILLDTDKGYMKQILSFLQTKKVKIIK